MLNSSRKLVFSLQVFDYTKRDKRHTMLVRTIIFKAQDTEDETQVLPNAGKP